MATSIKRTSVAGGSDPQVSVSGNDLANIFNVIDSVLTNAGWTVWYDGNSAPTYLRVYKSTGNSGKDAIFIRIQSPNNGTLIHRSGQYSNASNGNLYNSVRTTSNMVPTSSTWTTGTYDYFVMADLDSVMAYFTTGSTTYIIWNGNLARSPEGNANNLFSSNSETAGTFVTIETTTSPIDAGYAVGQYVTIGAQEVPGSDTDGGTLPCHMAIITAITSSSITVDRLLSNIAAGAIIGQDPLPYASSTGNGNAIGDLYCGNWHDYSLSNMYTSGGYNITNTNRITAGTVNPNLRKWRAAIEQPQLYYGNNEFRGYLSKMFLFENLAAVGSITFTAYARWDILASRNQSPSKHYIITSSSGSTPINLALGPYD